MSGRGMLTKERFVCLVNQLGGRIDAVNNDADLLPRRIGLVSLGGGYMVRTGLQQSRDTGDVDFFCPYAVELALLDDDNFHCSPVATGISTPLSNGFHAELFNKIEPDLSKRSDVSIGDGVRTKI